MATSGTFSQTFGTYYRLQMEWTATQSATAGTSTITAKLYLMSLSARSTISSSSSKTFRITIDGTASATTGNLNLSGNQKKLLHTFTKTVDHAPNGTKTVPIVGFMQWGLNVNGHTSDVTISKNEVLTPIQSSSTIGTISSWRAGESLSVGINRASTSYTHTLRVYIGSTLVATRTGIASSSYVFNFTASETQTIFNVIGRSTSAATRVELDTYSGSSKVGATDSKSALIAAGLPSTMYKPIPAIQVGEALTVGYTYNNSEFNHTLILKDGATELARDEVDGPMTVGIDTFMIFDELTSRIGSASFKDFTVELYTKYGAQVIRDPDVATVRVYPNEAAMQPEFQQPASLTIQTSEIHPGVSELLGSGEYFLSGKSNIVVTIPSQYKAVAKLGATIETYTVSIGNKSTSVLEGAGNITAYILGPTATGPVPITVTARDSRGNEATISKTVTFIPYADPQVNISAKRVGRFENTTNVAVSTPYSPVIKGSTPMNAITSRRYRTRQTNGAWSGWTAMSTTLNMVEMTFNLDNTKAWEIQVEVSDKITTSTRTITVSAGRPTLFIDAERNSVGINKFPTGTDRLEATGADMNGVTIGQALDDITKISGTFHIGKNASTISLGDGLIRAVAYSGDVSIYTNRPVFWFGNPIQAPQGITGNISSGGKSTFSDVDVNGTMKFSTTPIQSVAETGFCGIGGMGATGFSTAVAGVGVNFRIKKNYTPSSVYLSESSASVSTPAITIDITPDGFWLYINGSGSISYRYWRGRYTA